MLLLQPCFTFSFPSPERIRLRKRLPYLYSTHNSFSLFIHSSIFCSPLFTFFFYLSLPPFFFHPIDLVNSSFLSVALSPTGVCTNATAPSVSSINRILRNRAAERAAAEFARNYQLAAAASAVHYPIPPPPPAAVHPFASGK